MRIDKLLFYLRLSKSRVAAGELVRAGHIRLNGLRVVRPAQMVKPGDILVIPRGTEVQVIELLTSPARRGPPVEARGCYRVLDGARENPIAARQDITPEGTIEP